MTSPVQDRLMAEAQCGPEEAIRLEAYLSELDKWNRRFNLTRIGEDQVIERLVLGPLRIARTLGVQGRIVDVGAGNGSPGVVWAIAQGLTDVELVDSNRRRCAFLRHLVAVCGLEGVVVRETFVKPGFRTEPADWISVQGVRLEARLRSVLRAALKPRGRLVWLRAGAADPEVPAGRVVSPAGTEDWALVFDSGHETLSNSQVLE